MRSADITSTRRKGLEDGDDGDDEDDEHEDDDDDDADTEEVSPERVTRFRLFYGSGKPAFVALRTRSNEDVSNEDAAIGSIDSGNEEDEDNDDDDDGDDTSPVSRPTNKAHGGLPGSGG